MSREEHDPQDARTTRSSRRNIQATDRLPPNDPDHAAPVNPNWRGERTSGRGRKTREIPSSRQEFMLWLQYGGWRIIAIVAAVALLAIIGLIFLRAAPRPLSLPEPTAEASQGASPLEALPTVTPFTSQPTAVVTTQGAGGGAQFRVFNTGTQGLFLRPNPNTNDPALKTLPDGTIVTIIGEDSSGPDYVWKHVRDPEGTEGWAASDFLQPAQ